MMGISLRAIPLAIFQAEETVQKHYLRKWLKDSSISEVEIRDILDWSYYIERLGGAIQKIITIPAAMQGVPNPVPRVRHPDWLHKKILEKNDNFKQRRITDMFSAASKNVTTDSIDNSVNDIEDIVNNKPSSSHRVSVATVNKRKRRLDAESEFSEEELNKYWKEVLGNPPPYGSTEVSSIHKMVVFCSCNKKMRSRKSTVSGSTSKKGSGGFRCYRKMSASQIKRRKVPPWLNQ